MREMMKHFREYSVAATKIKKAWMVHHVRNGEHRRLNPSSYVTLV